MIRFDVWQSSRVEAMVSRAAASVLAGLCVALSVAQAGAARTSAAIDEALRAGGFYAGPHPAMQAAAGVHGLRSDSLGRRSLRIGDRGADVAELQLALAWQGFPSGTIDARFGSQLLSALTGFQRGAGLPADGVAGPTTMSALRQAPPRSRLLLAWPLLAPVGDRFGPRGDRFHEGIDLLAPFGTEVIAAAAGRVAWAGLRAGGWGKLVTLANGHRLRTMYAHLSRIDVKVGQWVSGGQVIGRVGQSGDATAPHLHFEVRVGDGAIDPLSVLVTLPTALRDLTLRKP